MIHFPCYKFNIQNSNKLIRNLTFFVEQNSIQLKFVPLKYRIYLTKNRRFLFLLAVKVINACFNREVFRVKRDNISAETRLSSKMQPRVTPWQRWWFIDARTSSFATFLHFNLLTVNGRLVLSIFARYI